MVDPRLGGRLNAPLPEGKGKWGQTVKQLQEHLNGTQGIILVVLDRLRKDGVVSMERGVWTMVRAEIN